VIRLLPQFRWLVLAGLLAALTAVPVGGVRSQDKGGQILTEADKQKQLAELQKQIAELNAKFEALKAAPIGVAAVVDPKAPAGTIPEGLLNPLAWRSIGPANMGGRVTALAVNESDPMMYWVGFGGGGLLKTVNNGTTFENQFDKETTCSIGDVAVAPSDANIVWVGTGENNPRNSVSYGDGVYKSTDGGKTWKNMGLKKTFQIGKVIVHPKNPDVVYVGALGRLYGDNEERGVFKTEDGGKTWNKVLYVDDKTGVTDMRIDPTDPNVLIAALWEHKRDEHDGFFGTPPVPDAYGPVVTHSPGTGLYKTLDGGKNWKKLTDAKLKNGLPTVKLGRIGLDYSRKTKGLLFAVIDTEKGGTGPAPSNTYFGAVLDDEKGGGVKLTEVTENSPAMKAGLKSGEIVTLADATKLDTAETFIDFLQSKKPNDKIAVTVKRDGKDVKVEVTLAVRNPEPPVPMGAPPSAGFRLARGDTLTVGTLVEDGPAAKAGVKEGDLITKVGDKAVLAVADYVAELSTKKAGDKVKITVQRDKETKLIEIVLGAPTAAGPPRGVTNARPFGMGLGGQQANVQRRQGKEGFETGGVFQSADNGETWTRINSLNPRPMYFSQIRVDPSDDKTIYVIGDVPTPLFRSTDGGANFANLSTAAGVHADGHALWIDPKDPRHMLIGCDGGFYATYDKGAKWDHINTVPMGQFYHVATDNRRPYRVYGGLQDNGSWGGPSDTLKRTGPTNEDWIFVSGGDGFVCRVDPLDADLVYSESQGGNISRRNYRTGESSGIRPPARKPGEAAYRFHWNTPFILSSHNSSIFYSGAQFVFKSVKKGDELKVISSDLTRTPAGSLTAIAESPKNPDVLWAGSDDGFIWLSKTGGTQWENLTANIQKAGLVGFRQTATIECSREKEGRAYVTFDAHRSDDDKPYIFLTEDFGATWKNIAAALPQFGSTRVCREDLINPNVLYAGTEFGPYVSINKGESWTKLGTGLPTVSCHEFAQPTTANELVVATHGRSVWILDINAIRQFKADTLKDAATLFAPAPAVRWKLGANGESPYSSTDRKFAGTNPSRGATFDILLTKKAEKLELKVIDANGKVVYEYRAPTQNLPANYRPITSAGFHRVPWNLAGPSGGGAAGGGRRPIGGGQVAPGTYKVLLTVDGKELPQSLIVELDPNASKDIQSTEDAVQTLEAQRKAAKKTEQRDDN